MYLWKRGAIWWFRRAIPVGLRARFGPTDVAYSLRTRDRRNARQLAMKLAVIMDDWSDWLKQAYEDDPEAPDRALLLRMFDEAMLIADQERKLGELKLKSQEITMTVAELERSQALTAKVKALGVRVHAMTDRFEELKERLRTRASSDRVDVDMKAYLANEMASLKIVIKEEIRGGHKHQWSGDLLSSKVEKYIESKRKALPGSKQVAYLPGKIRNFIDTIGDKPVRDYTREDFETYRDILDRTPKHAFTRYKTHDLKFAAEANAKLPRPMPILDQGSVDDNYLSPIKNFFTYLLLNQQIPSSPGVGVLSARAIENRRTERADEARSPFSADQINAYFKYMARNRSAATEDYWLPILALYTGARLNELCQIEPRRVIMHNDRWHIDLLTRYDKDEIDEAVKGLERNERDLARMQLKTASARRQIPIHDDLMKVGFIDFVDSRRGAGDARRLFPKIKPDQFGYYSSAVGKRLNLDLGRAKVKTKDTTFYSFRHNFAAALINAVVPDRTKDRIMGHLIGGAPGHYGNPELEEAETIVIERVKFPGVDITPEDVGGRKKR